MQREDANAGIPKESVLKIDKDCFVDPNWIRDYVRLIVITCRTYGVRVVSVKTCNSRQKGIHFYVDITPPIEAELANRLQFLLGDDSRRVDFNRARICSGLPRWNKLFEVADRIPRTIYRSRQRISLRRPPDTTHRCRQDTRLNQ